MAAKMPAKAFPPPPLPLTEGEVAVQKRQGAALQEDVMGLTKLNIHKPFQNIQDAIQRLVPFHVFAAADPSEADLDETQDHAGADLMVGRKEAWHELCVQKATDMRKKAESLEAAVQQLEARHQRQPSGCSLVDRWGWERVLEDSARKANALAKGQQTQQSQQAQQAALFQQLGYGLPQGQGQQGYMGGSSALVLTRPQPQQVSQQMLMLNQQHLALLQQQQHQQQAVALQQQQQHQAAAVYQQQQQAVALHHQQQQQAMALQQHQQQQQVAAYQQQQQQQHAVLALQQQQQQQAAAAAPGLSKQ